jgi:hypothetical protein
VDGFQKQVRTYSRLMPSRPTSVVIPSPLLEIEWRTKRVIWIKSSIWINAIGVVKKRTKKERVIERSPIEFIPCGIGFLSIVHGQNNCILSTYLVVKI